MFINFESYFGAICVFFLNAAVLMAFLCIFATIFGMPKGKRIRFFMLERCVRLRRWGHAFPYVLTGFPASARFSYGALLQRGVCFYRVHLSDAARVLLVTSEEVRKGRLL